MNYANSTSVQQQPAPMTPLQSASSALSGSIGGLEEQLTSLRNRLNPVLTPSAPTNTTGDSAQKLSSMPPPASDMTQDICNQSRRIDALAMSVCDLLVRLEV
jgi:hypothetical protein